MSDLVDDSSSVQAIRVNAVPVPSRGQLQSSFKTNANGFCERCGGRDTNLVHEPGFGARGAFVVEGNAEAHGQIHEGWATTTHAATMNTNPTNPAYFQGLCQNLGEYESARYQKSLS